ncbi:type I restriction enzyme HsdR N-terminal domain-containing protein [Tepidimonas charontis]|uniref:type I restriction enzyme HsdR N-terminal domain-containing protein n=1 Tax=Tepidimonas charontis TaxID=2267262 RepID=UPI00191C1424|nr:type I restriction enzyme HsdR N-terminal domain-containing protein [Tepidimonas charontis]
MSWEDIRALVASLAVQSRETDRLIRELRESSRETDRRMQETHRQLRELGWQIAGLGDKFGYFAEGMALPSMERILLTRFGMETINPRVRVRRGGREQEYDVLAWANGAVNTAVIVEVKSRVKREAIEQLKQQLQELPQLIPELAGNARIGILSGIGWDPGVMQEAQAAGLYTATIHDEVFELTTPKDFTPRRWKAKRSPVSVEDVKAWPLACRYWWPTGMATRTPCARWGGGLSHADGPVLRLRGLSDANACRADSADAGRCRGGQRHGAHPGLPTACHDRLCQGNVGLAREAGGTEGALTEKMATPTMQSLLSIGECSNGSLDDSSCG